MWNCLTGRESPWALTWQSDPNANANVMNASQQVPLCQEDVKHYVEQFSILSHLKTLLVILILPAEIQNLSSATLSKSYLRWNRRRQLRKADHDIDLKWNMIGTTLGEGLHMEAAKDASDYISMTWQSSSPIQLCQLRLLLKKNVGSNRVPNYSLQKEHLLLEIWCLPSIVVPPPIALLLPPLTHCLLPCMPMLPVLLPVLPSVTLPTFWLLSVALIACRGKGFWLGKHVIESMWSIGWAFLVYNSLRKTVHPGVRWCRIISPSRAFKPRPMPNPNKPYEKTVSGFEKKKIWTSNWIWNLDL